MKIISKFLARISLLIFGIPALFVVCYIVFLCSHPTDYAPTEVIYKKKLGNQYELNLEKGKLFNRLSPAHPFSDTLRNLSDSLFVLYFHPSNDSIRLNALVRIIKKDKNFTIIKFDSIIGYSFRGYIDSHYMAKIIDNYDSIDYVDQFYKNVIRKLITDSVESSDVYYDNKLILDTFKK
jgi:hypothetical protein